MLERTHLPWCPACQLTDHVCSLGILDILDLIRELQMVVVFLLPEI